MANLASNHFQTASATDAGRRRTLNEDSLGMFVPVDRQQRQTWGSLYVVADGMGGHQAGAIASDRVVRKVLDEYYYGRHQSPHPGKRLQAAIQSANQDTYLLQRERQEWTGMGSTVVAVVVMDNGESWIGNVGDSRAYYISPQGIRQLTEDHTWVNEQVKQGFISPGEAQGHQWRHRLHESIGRRSLTRMDIQHIRLSEGDSLLLTTDGLTDVVKEAEIRELVLGHSPQAAVERLIALANWRGGPDNITVLLITRPAPANPRVARRELAERAEKQARPIRPPIKALWLLIMVVLAVALISLTGSAPPGTDIFNSGQMATGAVPDNQTGADQAEGEFPAVVTAPPTSTRIRQAAHPAATIPPTSTRMPTQTPTPTRQPPTATATATPLPLTPEGSLTATGMAEQVTPAATLPMETAVATVPADITPAVPIPGTNDDDDSIRTH